MTSYGRNKTVLQQSLKRIAKNEKGRLKHAECRPLQHEAVRYTEDRPHLSSTLLATSEPSCDAHSGATNFRLSLLCLSPGSLTNPTTITQLFTTDINLLRCHHTSTPASPSLTTIT